MRSQSVVWAIEAAILTAAAEIFGAVWCEGGAFWSGGGETTGLRGRPLQGKKRVFTSNAVVQRGCEVAAARQAAT